MTETPTLVDDVTELLANGATLPDHPASTTGLKIVSFGQVSDDADGTVLTGGLHQSEISMLMNGSQMSLGHLYRFAIRNGKIFHTRRLVTIDCKCEPVQFEL